MDGLTASVSSTGPVPRLRITRHTTSLSSHTNEQDSLAHATPLHPNSKLPSTYPDSQTSEDESGNIPLIGATSRLLSASLPPPDSSTQSNDTTHTTHRLRALLSRFDTPSRNPASTPRVVMPPSPSEPESDFDLRPAQIARASIKDLFQNAMREPGDTPQKPKLRRRASFNAVSSPKVSKSRRRSTSDEEREILSGRHHRRRSDMSAAESLDRLRLQLTESMTSVQDVSSVSSTSYPPSEASTTTPQAATPHFPRQSRNSASHTPSNHVKSHKDLEPFRPVSGGENGQIHSSPRQILHPRPDRRAQSSTPAHSSSHIPLENVSTSATNLITHDESNHHRSSRSRTNSSQAHVDHQEQDRNHHHPSSAVRNQTTSSEALHSSVPNKGRLSPGAWPTPPPPGSKPSHTRSPRHSLNNRNNDGDSGHSEDGYSSRSSSAISKIELHDRLNETERERQHELERSWNRPHSRNSQSTPHLHAKAHLHSHVSRPVSSLGHSHEGTHSLLHSRSGHDRPRSISPASSSYHDEFLEDHEVEHERERNWNAPRPKWGQHVQHHAHSGVDHHNSSDTSSSGPPVPPDQEQQSKHTRSRTSSASPNAVNGHSHHYSHVRPQHHSPRPLSSHSHSRERSESPSSARSLQNGDIGKQHEQNWNPPRRRREQHPHHDHPTSASPSLHSHSQTLTASSKASPPSFSPPIPRSSSARRPRPNSPLPPLINGTQETHEIGVDPELNEISREVSSSPRHEHTELRTSQLRSGSKSNGEGSTSPLDQELRLTTDPLKRHRRTTTELSESTGPFPRQNGLPSSLTISDDDSNVSLFADESVPPPQMSTPTFKSAHLPELSVSPVLNHTPLPPSPESPVATKRDPAARADADLARLQRAVAPNFTFPERHSPPSPVPSPPPGSRVAAASQQSVASTNSSKLQPRTPPPQIEPSELPDTRSILVEQARTPLKAAEEPRITSPVLKTPRFPGAFGTPFNSHPQMVSPDDVEEEAETTPRIKPMDDLPPTHIQTNGSAFVPPTPAPPGVYRATPTPAKRKGILKVRFDGDVQTPEDVAEEPEFTSVVSTGNSKNGSSAHSSSSETDVPLTNLSPSRRKGLRLVDEYGRARRFTEDGEEILLDTRRKSVDVITAVPDDTTTPRRRAKMRQVDALGNEITDGAGSKSEVEPNKEVPESQRKKAVLSRLARSLVKLQDDVAEEESALGASVPVSGQRDDERMLDLATVSRAARVERNKLARKLQLERHAEDGIADKIFVARNPRQDLRPWEETLERASWWQRKWRLAMIILILELAFLYMGYRLAMMHAKHIWLKTHFDPFFPALYMHQSRPNFLSRFGTLPRGWSAFALSDAVQRVGVKGFLAGVSRKIWEDIWSWRLEPWEAWGSPAAGPPVPRPWPS